MTVDNASKLVANPMFNGGCRATDSCWAGYQYHDNPQKMVSAMVGHCRETQANTVFMFLTVGVLMGSAVLGFARARKGY